MVHLVEIHNEKSLQYRVRELYCQITNKSTLFLTSALEGGEGSTSHPGCNLSPAKTRDPLYRRLVGPQGRSGQVQKISPQSGFDPPIVQPVGSRYTDYATRPTNDNVWFLIIVPKEAYFVP